MALKLRDAYHFVKDEVYDLVVSVYAWYIFNKYLKPKNND